MGPSLGLPSAQKWGEEGAQDSSGVGFRAAELWG